MSVIIVGGGMVGSTLALAIAHLTDGRLPVQLVEGAIPGSQAHPGFDSRALALAAGTCQQLQRIGVWPALAKQATAITEIHVSDRGHLGQVQLSHRDYRLPALGQVIELHAAGEALFNVLKKAPGVNLHCPQEVVDVQRDAAQVRVTLSQGQQLTGQLLVIANGSRSSLARDCGIDWQTEQYQQVAIIANVVTQQPHNGQAFERFTAEGPLALLPMSDNRLSLVWCLSAHKAAELLALENDHFLLALQQAFGWRLGQFKQVGKRDSYPLALQQASSLHQHRVVLAGNAAQTLHPIAGQGFNLGLRDAISLAETVSDAYRLQQDLGSDQVLHSYQHRRQSDRAKTIAITDGLVRTFANDYWPMVIGRNLGLLVMDKVPGFKHLLATRTLGWVQR